MKQMVLAVLVLALIAVPAQAQKVYIDYDSTVDFSALETFAWKDAGKPNLADVDPLLHQYIVDSIMGRLEGAGLSQSEDPDFFITYHTESQTEVRLDTTNYGYGYGRGWRWGGYGYGGPSSTTVRTYEKGTLILDAWDGSTKELIWRGSATSTLTDNPDKARKKIDKSINKIVKKWDKEYRKK